MVKKRKPTSITKPKGPTRMDAMRRQTMTSINKKKRAAKAMVSYMDGTAVVLESLAKDAQKLRKKRDKSTERIRSLREKTRGVLTVSKEMPDGSRKTRYLEKAFAKTGEELDVELARLDELEGEIQRMVDALEKMSEKVRQLEKKVLQYYRDTAQMPYDCWRIGAEKEKYREYTGGHADPEEGGSGDPSVLLPSLFSTLDRKRQTRKT